MKKMKPAALAIAVATVGALALSGCATKKFVREQVGVVDTKVQTQQGQIATHDTRLGQLDATTKEALDRATAAGKLAEGKFLYSMVLSDDSVKFPVNGSELSPEAQTRLMEFAQKLKTDNRNVYLEIQGHTDADGAADFNQRLGQQRAEAVRMFMNRQGVALNRMATISYGEEAPVADNGNPDGKAQNRRVVVIVLA